MKLCVMRCLKRAHRAVNKLAHHKGRAAASVAWDEYCQAQGGVFCGRKAAIKLTMRVPEGLGRYGEVLAPRPYGVETEFVDVRAAGEDAPTSAASPVNWIVESERHTWSIERSHRPALTPVLKVAEITKSDPPRTRVNNCTKVRAACNHVEGCPRGSPNQWAAPSGQQAPSARSQELFT